MLHWETVSPELKTLLESIGSNPKFNAFRLCGGTSLALQLGHRLSVDADYVSETQFDKEDFAFLVAQELPETGNIVKGEIGVFLSAKNIKLDFLSWGIPFIRPVVEYGNIRLIAVEEIAAMKLFAVTQRGEKKDYYDIAILLRTYPLQDLLHFYLERHPKNNAGLVAKFLVGFGDINFQPDPVMLTDFSWEDAKNLLRAKVKEYFGEA